VTQNNMSSMLDPLYFFLHVPKTGGSSLRLALNNMFKPRVFYFTRSDQTKPFVRNKKLWATTEFYKPYSLIGGHIARNHPVVESKHLERPKTYISVFRDPVARAVSLYDFTRRRPSHPLKHLTKQKSLYEAFTTEGVFRNKCTQAQLRLAFGTANISECEDILARDHYIIAPLNKIDGLLDAVAAVSGLERPEAVPYVNSAGAAGSGDILRAKEQPDFKAAIDAISEANAPEIEFIARHINEVLITGQQVRKVI